MTSKQNTDIQAKILAANDSNINLAADALREGNLVGMPTETVYGLAANALDDLAVLKIYKAKERPSFNPLIVHVANVDMAMAVAEVTPLAKTIMNEFWPGPLTIVLKRAKDCPLSDIVSAGLDTVALRSPNHKTALKLLNQAKLPLAAPSANKSGSISPTSAQHVADGLGAEVACVLDGGEAKIGVESSIISLENDKVTLLRPGSITREMLETVVGTGVTVHNPTDNEGATAPGQLESHYAPKNIVRINVNKPNEGEFLIGFGNITGDINLSPNGDVDEAATNLFAMLRLADEKAKHGIGIAPIPNQNIGIAINDRIKRAAAPRS